jgi:prepilin peptidase CpaA
VFNDILLLLVLLICIITDIKFRKIYNGVLIPALFLGLLVNLASDGLSGLFFGLKGFLLGLGFLIIPFIMGGIGGGDVKLLATIGAVKGPQFVFYTFLGMGLTGGILAIGILIYQGKLIKTLKELGNGLMLFFATRFKTITFGGNNDENLFPYGVAITLGALAAYVMG